MSKDKRKGEDGAVFKEILRAPDTPAPNRWLPEHRGKWTRPTSSKSCEMLVDFLYRSRQQHG